MVMAPTSSPLWMSGTPTYNCQPNTIRLTATSVRDRTRENTSTCERLKRVAPSCGVLTIELPPTASANQPGPAVGISAPSETKKALARAIKAAVATPRRSGAEPGAKGCSGATETATKSRPTNAAPAPALARKKLVKAPGDIGTAPLLSSPQLSAGRTGTSRAASPERWSQSPQRINSPCSVSPTSSSVNSVIEQLCRCQ